MNNLSRTKIIQSRYNYWRDSNIAFFGVEPREWDNMSMEEIERALEEDKNKYWNVEEPCEIMQLVLSEKICKGIKHFEKNSIFLKFNNESECIDVYGEFKFINRQKEIELQERLIMSIPSPHTHFSWIINEKKWVPRIHCYYNRKLLRKDEDGIVSLGYRDKKNPSEGSQLWDYDTKTKSFTIYKERINKRKKSVDLIELIPEQSIAMLEAVMDGEKITEENLEEALIKMPVFDSKSVYSLSYQHLDVFFNSIRMSKRFASPLKGIPLSIHGAFLKTSTKGNSFYDVNNKLVLFKSVIGAVKNFNTVVYRTMHRSFSFEDTKYFFDAFKTSTNSKSAGKQRLILDNIVIKDNMLWVKGKDNKEYNMYQVMKNPSVQKQRLSKISQSLFCNNNAPKRIMLTAKLSAQSVAVKGQEDNITNRVMARVVFGDLEGYSLADSIIVSESFAEKLRAYENIPVIINKNKDSEIYDFLNNKIASGDYSLTSEDLMFICPDYNMMYAKHYENLKIKSYQIRSKNVMKLNISGELPFKNGNKLTSLHGAKGVCGLIIPDNEMPYLKNPIGDFEAGPFEVIISGLSLMRRGSMGQLFEAWANAAGIEFNQGEDDYIKLAVEKYYDEMKDFSKKSVVVYNGVEDIKACGMINMIRLYHHASKQSSTAFLKTNYSKLLKIGYMEQLNMIANGGESMLTELGIRGLRKHANSYSMIYNMMTKGVLPEKLQPSPSFNKLLRSMGMDMLLDGNSLVNTDNTEPDEIFNQLYKDTVDDKEINIIDLYEGGKNAN